MYIYFFFFNDTATTEIYTLSLHDALPISTGKGRILRRASCIGGIDFSGTVVSSSDARFTKGDAVLGVGFDLGDRKSTRLNSSHANISYAVFCLKKKQ